MFHQLSSIIEVGETEKMYGGEPDLTCDEGLCAANCPCKGDIARPGAGEPLRARPERLSHSQGVQPGRRVPPALPLRKWIFSGLYSTNKGIPGKTHFFLLLIDYNDFLEDFKQNPQLEKS